MSIRFTADEAFEAADAGEPILITRKAALRILDNHGPDDSALAEFEELFRGEDIPAHGLLGWLGY